MVTFSQTTPEHTFVVKIQMQLDLLFFIFGTS